MFGFLLGTTLAGASSFYYIIDEYRVSNELLTEDIYALQAAVRSIPNYVEERLDALKKEKKMFSYGVSNRVPSFTVLDVGCHTAQDMTCTLVSQHEIRDEQPSSGDVRLHGSSSTRHESYDFW
ncbi:MAG: hypothetical protein Q9212_002902 [Teloschistes hypoglaucus]